MDSSSSILVPVDFSEYAQAAVERAVALAQASGAEIRLLHASFVLPANMETSLSERLSVDLREGAKAQLETLVSALGERGVRVSSRLEDRDPSDAIHAAAREPGVELIVMGSHGRRGLDRLLLGSVAERTVQAAPVPVWVVRGRGTAPAPPIPSILFATDFSPPAERAERVVGRWAHALGAEVEIFHAIRETAVLFAPYAVAGSSDWEGELMESAERRIESVAKRFREAGIKTRSKIVYGLAGEEIVAHAERTGVRLIAVGSSGYSALQRFVLGSEAQRVLRHAPCSVLVDASG